MSGDEEMPLIHSCVVGLSGLVLLFFCGLTIKVFMTSFSDHIINPAE